MADHILTQDPTKPGVVKGNGPILASGNTVPLSGLDVTGAVNGDAIVLTGGVWTPGTAGASSDTASNLGGGAQVFKSKVAADFQFRSILAGSNITVTQNANDISISSTGSSVFTTSFTSANQVITAAGPLVLAHGLGGMPTLMQMRIINTTGEHGYSIGDELMVNFGADYTASYECSVVPDATNLNIRYGSSGGVFYINNKTTGDGIAITAANWQMIIRAWR